jgi:tetratricopeptide (TPR) repeat protein
MGCRFVRGAVALTVAVSGVGWAMLAGGFAPASAQESSRLPLPAKITDALKESVRLARAYKPEEAIRVLEKTLEEIPPSAPESHRRPVITQLGNLYSTVGLNRERENKIPEAIVAFEKSAARLEKYEPRDAAQVLHTLANLYHGQGRVRQALAASERAIALFQSVGDVEEEAAATGDSGVYLYDLARYEEALAQKRRSLTLFERVNDKRGQASALTGMGSAYGALGKTGEALSAYHRALDLYRDRLDVAGEAAVLNNIGVYLIEIARYDEALTYLKNADEGYRKVGDERGRARSSWHRWGVYRPCPLQPGSRKFR